MAVDATRLNHRIGDEDEDTNKDANIGPDDERSVRTEIKHLLSEAGRRLAFERFGAAAKAAGAQIHGPIPQGVFLARLGLLRRANQLARNQPAAKAAAAMHGARRLTEPDRMGRLFKAIALVSPRADIPPGFV